jgi:hypothetical protein
MSTLKVNNIDTQTGSNIVVASGKNFIAPNHIIQVVDGVDATQTTSTSTTFTASNLTVTITPKFTSSKILVGYSMTTYNTVNLVHNKLTIYRSIDGGTATNLGNATWGLSVDGNGTGNAMGSQSATTHDSPNTTSSVVYTVYGAPHDGGGGTGTLYFNINNVLGQMFAMEIAQ